MSVSPIPEGYNSVSPHLVVKNAREAIGFYERAFGAKVADLHDAPGGGVMHAALRIGNSTVMVNDEFPDWGVLSPASIGGSPVTIHVYVDDADAVFRRAVDAGAEQEMPLQDTFWGDRYGKLKDPYGHRWSIATRVRNLSAEEIQAAAAAAFSTPPQG
jgi:uncharacterized glyoxalase superfamily protein PhnB